VKKALPVVIPLAEFLAVFALPEDSYVKAVCWSQSPPACSFEFSPSPAFFLAVALPFIATTTFALWKGWKDSAASSISAGIALLAGVLFLAIKKEIVLLVLIALLVLLFGGLLSKVETTLEKEEKSLWATVAILGFLIVWILVRMGTGRTV